MHPWPRSVRIAVWIGVGFMAWGLVVAVGWLFGRAV